MTDPRRGGGLHLCFSDSLCMYNQPNFFQQKGGEGPLDTPMTDSNPTTHTIIIVIEVTYIFYMYSHKQCEFIHICISWTEINKHRVHEKDHIHCSYCYSLVYLYFQTEPFLTVDAMNSGRTSAATSPGIYVNSFGLDVFEDISKYHLCCHWLRQI